MGEIVNLRTERKHKARAAAAAKATENRAKFGQTKASKTLKKAQDELAQRNLNGHRLKDET
jgi:chorismate mutase